MVDKQPLGIGGDIAKTRIVYRASNIHITGQALVVWHHARENPFLSLKADIRGRDGIVEFSTGFDQFDEALKQLNRGFRLAHEKIFERPDFAFVSLIHLRETPSAFGTDPACFCHAFAHRSPCALIYSSQDYHK